MQQFYEKYKANFDKYGALVNLQNPERKGKLNKKNYLERLGGEIEYGNWSSSIERKEYPKAFEMKIQYGKGDEEVVFDISYLWKRPSRSLHGEARFSGMADLVRAGFFKQSDTSLVVGKYNGKLLHYSGQQFALLAAPTPPKQFGSLLVARDSQTVVVKNYSVMSHCP